jgi:hypothetical protein
MKWLVDQIYGAGSSDPYYQFFVDADALIPWWYPTMICTITAVILLYRFHNRFQFRRRTVMAADRVQKRTRRRTFRN